MAIPRSHRPCFLSLFWPGTSVTIPQTQSVRPEYGHWRPSLNYKKQKKTKKNPVWQTVVVWLLTSWSKTTLKKMKKNPVCGTAVWSLVDRVKNLLGKKVCQTVGMASGGLTSVAIPQSHRLRFFFLSLFRHRTSVTITWTRSVRPWYGHWHPSLKY